MMVTRRRSAVAGLLAAVLASGPALAQDKLRIGKSVPNSWAFAATDVGVQTGIFKQEGIELAISSFKGDAQMQAGLTAGAVDVSLGSGPGLGFRAKGVPAIGVAAMYGAPSNLAVVVLAKSPIKTVADLKGKRIGVTTAGSLTDWLSRELARQQGWGRDGMQVMPLGSMQARLAAMERGDLDAHGDRIGDRLRARGAEARAASSSTSATSRSTSTPMSSSPPTTMVEKRPDALRRFLRGWFKTIAFIRANKAETVKITVQGDRRARKHREPDLRRAGRRLLARRRVGSGRHRGDPQVAQGSRHPGLAAGGAHDLQRQVRAGEVLT